MLHSHRAHAEKSPDGRPIVNSGELEMCEPPQDVRVLKAIENETLVDWDGPNDAQNPMNWPPARKWATIALVSTITFVT